MNLRVEAFPWKLEDFSKSTIPTQLCKLVEFYWLVHSFVAQGIQQWKDSSDNLYTMLKDNAEKMRKMEEQNEHLTKEAYLIQMECKALLNTLQNLQASMDALLQYCGIHPHPPQGSVSNPSWIEDEDMTN